jgi:hypothetical protein
VALFFALFFAELTFALPAAKVKRASGMLLTAVGRPVQIRSRESRTNLSPLHYSYQDVYKFLRFPRHSRKRSRSPTSSSTRCSRPSSTSTLFWSSLSRILLTCTSL